MIPNDPLFKSQWHLHVLEMEKVWDVEIGSPDVIVAVVESGFDIHHPDLKSRIYKAINTFGAHDNMLSEHPTNAEEQNDHGTHMLGLIGAEINNGEGGVGVAPGCRLMPVKIANNLSDDDLALGIRTAVDEGAKIINLSNTAYLYLGKLGKTVVPRQGSPPPSNTLFDTCQYAIKHEVLICSIVGGNQGFIEMAWPAAYHLGLNVIQGNVEGTGPANFRTINTYADILSPGGERVPSGNPDWPWSQSDDKQKGLLSTVQVKNGSYHSQSGGCQATAVASGAAALLYSRFPDLTVSQARQVICNTAKGTGWTREEGHGYICPLEFIGLERIECELNLNEPKFSVKSGRVEVTVENRGVLDAVNVLSVLYANEPDTVPARQLIHVNIPLIRGRESHTVVFDDFEIPQGTKCLWVVIDPKFQLSTRQRNEKYLWLKHQVTEIK